MNRHNGDTIEITAYRDFSEECLDAMYTLERTIFENPWSRETLARKCASKLKCLALIAKYNTLPVAFKVGYEMNEQVFYSWLGGVTPEFRHRGLARQLMQKQHTLLAEFGYSIIRTHTQNKFRDMLVLNIRSGFDIVGLINESNKTETTIVLEKSLHNHAD